MSESFPSSTKGSLLPSLREWSLATSVSFVVALAVVGPFFKLGTASGHDVAFHMASWLDAAGQWKQGVIFPRWTEWANFGFGEPRFIFYPPLSWLFGAFLGTVIRWDTVALVFNLCVQTFAGVSAYGLLRRIADTRYAALVGAGCFAANPYALLIVYMRSDFAELLAIAVFPLLLLAGLRLCGAMADPPERSQFAQVFLFALAFCAVWLSNAPAGVIATYSAALFFVIAAIRARSAVPLLRGTAGIALGFGLAGFYLIPAFYEQRWVNITGVLAEGLTPADNFLFAKTSDAEHDAFNHIASWLAVVLIVWMCLAAAATWRSVSPRRAGIRTGSTLASVAVLAATATLLMLPVTNIAWRLLPELRFVQFPWRWMSVVALCVVTTTAISARGWLRWAWPVAIAVTFLVCGHYLVQHAWWDTEDMPTLEAAIKDGTGFEGTDEYDPIGDDHSALPNKQARVEIIAPASEPESRKEVRVVIEEWNAEHRRIHVAARKPARLAIRLLRYPAWRTTVNDKPAQVAPAKNSGEMIVPVGEGTSEIKIDFARTPDRTIGGYVSLVALLGSASALLWRRRAGSG